MDYYTEYLAVSMERDRLRARVAELDAENAKLKHKMESVGCWDDDPAIDPLLRKAFNPDAE